MPRVSCRAARAVTALFAAWPMAAAAAENPIPPGLVAVLERPEHRRDLLVAVQAVDAATATRCTTGSYATSGEVGLLSAFREDATGNPTAGVWKESVIETGCGAPRQLNALTSVARGGKMVTEPLLPGTTITDPELQRDSVQYAASALGTMPPGCDQGGVTDTEFVGVEGEPAGVRPKPGDVPKPWTERWTLQACAKRAIIAMRFTPDATGTGIEAKP